MPRFCSEWNVFGKFGKGYLCFTTPALLVEWNAHVLSEFRQKTPVNCALLYSRVHFDPCLIHGGKGLLVSGGSCEVGLVRRGRRDAGMDSVVPSSSRTVYVAVSSENLRSGTAITKPSMVVESGLTY